MTFASLVFRQQAQYNFGVATILAANTELSNIVLVDPVQPGDWLRLEASVEFVKGAVAGAVQARIFQKAGTAFFTWTDFNSSVRMRRADVVAAGTERMVFGAWIFANSPGGTATFALDAASAGSNSTVANQSSQLTITIHR